MIIKNIKNKCISYFCIWSIDFRHFDDLTSFENLVDDENEKDIRICSISLSHDDEYAIISGAPFSKIVSV